MQTGQRAVAALLEFDGVVARFFFLIGVAVEQVGANDELPVNCLKTAVALFLVLMPPLVSGKSETSSSAPIGTFEAKPTVNSVAVSMSMARARSS